MSESFDNPRDLLHRLGYERVAKAIGRDAGRVRSVAGEDKIPAQWYTAVRNLCSEDGIECDEGIFAFVSVEKQTADS